MCGEPALQATLELGPELFPSQPKGAITKISRVRSATHNREGKNQIRGKTWRLIFCSFISSGNPQGATVQQDEFGPEIRVTKTKQQQKLFQSHQDWTMANEACILGVRWERCGDKI